MPGRGRAKGGGLGQDQRPGPDHAPDQRSGHGHARDAEDRPMDDAERGRPEGRGRSAMSPGHRKQAAGARSAREYAPGRAGEAGVPESGDIESGRGLL